MQAWRFFALFVTVITALILEPIPTAAIGLIGVTLAAALMMVPAKIGTPATAGDGLRFALSGFSNGTVWLIFTAYMFSLGYEKTGLGKRISLLLIKALGKKTLGLGYAVALADLVGRPFHAVQHGAERRHHLPDHQEHPAALRQHARRRSAQDRRLRDVDRDGHHVRDEQHVPHRPRAESARPRASCRRPRRSRSRGPNGSSPWRRPASSCSCSCRGSST